MSKNEAIKSAAKLLSNIYAEEDEMVAQIVLVEEDKDCEVLKNELDVVINYCNKLKEAMED